MTDSELTAFLEEKLTEFFRQYIDGVVVDWVLLANYVPNSTDGDQTGFSILYKGGMMPFVSILGMCEAWRLKVHSEYTQKWNEG